MQTVITDYCVQLFKSTRKVRKSSSGWISGNAPCCVHRGNNADRRGRGGIKTTDSGGVSYHCFNCTYKASYTPGRALNYKFRKLLEWMGADPGEIERLVIEALRLKEIVALQEPPEHTFVLPDFPKIEFPFEHASLWEMVTLAKLSDVTLLPKNLVDAVNYIHERDIDFQEYDFYLSDETKNNLHKRVIIPLYWGNKIVGYTGRLMYDGGKSKYFTSSPPNYVFNLNKQMPDAKFVIVCEGPFDAMSIDGVAVLGNTISETQADIIDSLDREIIVVADSDKAGKTLIRAALRYGWSVSFPVWLNKAKDINKAIQMYGKLYVMKSILEGKENNPLKIRLRYKGLGFS